MLFFHKQVKCITQLPHNLLTEEQMKEIKNRSQHTNQFFEILANSNLTKKQIERQLLCHIELYYPHIPKDHYRIVIDCYTKEVYRLRSVKSIDING